MSAPIADAVGLALGPDGLITEYLTAAAELAPDVALPPEVATVTPSLAFLLGDPLRGPGVTSAGALAGVRSVHGALTVQDDGGRVRGFLTGPVGVATDRPGGLDLTLEGVLVVVDGAVVDSATGAAVLGHPARALAAAANALGPQGVTLERGWLVLTGGLTAPVPVRPGAVIACEYTHLGALGVRAGA
ncbi:4-oxalocrotonate decarboxylase [Spongisporangium articulatum]|uniref:4-oxalocrotonate decarboxylase n=1 Tax=Spongisporangium articulatum TaxID=3362603 RepID=A0ABW8ATK3_9ACTN